MCNCKKEIEKNLVGRVKEHDQEAKNHSVELMGYTLVVTASLGLQMKGCMETTYTADFPMKKGGYKQRKRVQNIVFNYCPFCGEKLPVEEAA